MKKFLTSIAMVLLLVGCAKEYDDSGLRELISALDTRVTALESNVQALQSAIGEGVFVAKVQEYVDPDTGKTIGVTVTYTNGDVKYFQIHPKDNTENPVLGVIKSGSGDLVWAIDGVAILIDGEEVPVYQTPVFSLDEEGYLWVEVDGKKTQLGQVQNSGATLEDGIFTDIKVEQDKIILTLSDETTVTIPFAEAFKIELMLDECIYTEAEPMSVHYALTAATAGTVVRVAGYSPFQFAVSVNNEDKIIEITPLMPGAAATFLIVADSGIGLVSTATLVVEPEGLAVVDPEEAAEYDYLAEGNDGVVEAHVVSNVPFDVVPVDEWITVASIKAQAYTITLKLEDNKTEDIRTGSVNIVRAGTDQVLQTLVIAQLVAENEDGPVNLSKKESANCYIITAAGDYKFKTVKGNSTESVGAVASAEVLWETVNTAEAPAVGGVIAAVAVDGDFITFSTAPGLKPGNALIAAKDEGGTILWSWHIWIPSTQIITSTYGGIVTYPMMDRNLGALVAPAAGVEPTGPSTGFLYQWGRKDPFPALADMSSSTPFAMNGTAITYDSPKQNYTIAESIQIPTVYIKTGGDSNKTWMTEEEKGTETWAATKTIYDPCPAGYMVPATTASGSLWGGTATYVVESKLIKASASAEASEFAIFPVGGYLDQGSITKRGERSYHWTSVQSADKNIAYMLYANGSNVTVEVQRMSRGGNVRCVAIDENAPTLPEPEFTDPAVNLGKEGTANSYIVEAAGEYKFPAVKGNTEDSVGEVATAELLWETWNNQEEVTANSVIASVEYKEGYIRFSTPGSLHAGNALIAAKDAEGKILWSWHIWIPADEIALVTEAQYSTKAIMDRNLGALEAAVADAPAPVESFGMLYEWGRKDPFPGLGVTSGTGAATVAGTAITYQDTRMTLEEAIQNPTVYVKTVKSWTPEATATTDDGALWGETTKTVYDPCPVGYMLPQRLSTDFWKGTNMATVTGFSYSVENGNFAYGALVFPIAGYLDKDEGHKKAGERSLLWSGRWDSGTENGYGFFSDATASEPSFKRSSQNRTRGGSVRCVAEAAAE